MLKKIKLAVFIFIPFMLVACNGFFAKDNVTPPAPLVTFPALIHPHMLWSTQVGNGSNEHLKLQPAVSQTAVVTTSYNGVVTNVDKLTGYRRWQIATGHAITTGPGVGHGMVVVGTRKGLVLAFKQANGEALWQARMPGEILSTPAIYQYIVVVKTINGYVRALSAETGDELWSYQQTEPNLILRGASAPLIRHQRIIVGFANGKLAKLNLTGQLAWVNQITEPQGAFAIQRMIDIDADPFLYDHHLYAATFQGKLAALSWGSGDILWQRDLSSYTGMVADESSIYISDADSYLWAFNSKDGSLIWNQTQLRARGITAPALLSNYVIVGDQEGYLHWLNKFDGHFSAREKIGGSLSAAPVVSDRILYAYTNEGRLVAFTLTN